MPYKNNDKNHKVTYENSGVSIQNADKLINMLEEENQARKTARGFKRRSLTRGSSRRSTVKPTGLTGRPGTTPTC